MPFTKFRVIIVIMCLNTPPNEIKINYTNNKQKSFVGVVQMLSEMHLRGFVHGDVRLDNIVFSDDRSHVINCSFDIIYIG